jgi:hypothetical protein
MFKVVRIVLTILTISHGFFRKRCYYGGATGACHWDDGVLLFVTAFAEKWRKTDERPVGASNARLTFFESFPASLVESSAAWDGLDLCFSQHKR